MLLFVRQAAFHAISEHGGSLLSVEEVLRFSIIEEERRCSVLYLHIFLLAASYRGDIMEKREGASTTPNPTINPQPLPEPQHQPAKPCIHAL